MVVYLTYCTSASSAPAAIESGEGDVEMSCNLIGMSCNLIGTNNGDNDNTSTNDNTNTNRLQGVNDRNISFDVYTDRHNDNTSVTRGIFNIE